MRHLRTDLSDDGRFLPILEESEGQDIPAYAILSHTWEQDEVLFSDVFPNPQNAHLKKGFLKIEKAAERARVDGYEYIWIDTCCINKVSSAELQEAINSMYIWYQNAGKCYAYLFDLSSDAGTLDHPSFQKELRRSKWFTRGWTLQELLAPRMVIFYSSVWEEVGTKFDLAKLIASITSIDVEYLIDYKSTQLASVAERMLWAASRQTRRIEDVAYCLMGIFDVNMPMLYGEGPKAFLRLQEEIWKRHEDQSLFAWVDPTMSDTTQHGLLADNPGVFATTASVSTFVHEEGKSSATISSKGVRIELPIRTRNNVTQAGLNCPPLDSTSDSGALLNNNVEKLDWGSNQYVRVSCNRLDQSTYHQDSLQTLFVPQHQTHQKKRMEQILYPETIVHFCCNENASFQGQYALIDVLYDSSGCRSCLATKPISHENCGSSAWIFDPFPTNLRIANLSKLVFAFLFRRRLDDSQIIVFWGIDGQSQLVFSALPTETRQFDQMVNALNDLRSRLVGESAKSMNDFIQLPDHEVRVSWRTSYGKMEKWLTINLDLYPRWFRGEEYAKDAIAPQYRLPAAPTDNGLFNLSSRRRKFKGDSSCLTAVAFSADGKRIVSGATSGLIQIWNITTGEMIKAYHHCMFGIRAVAFHLLDELSVLFVSETGAIWRWRWAEDRDDGMMMNDPKDLCKNSYVSAAIISKDQTKIILMSRSSIWLWNSTSREIQAIRSSWDGLSRDCLDGFNLAISPDASQFAIFRRNIPQAALLDSVTGAVSLLLEESRIMALAFLPDGKKFATYENGCVRFWDLATLNQKVLTSNQKGIATMDVSVLIFSPTGNRMALISLGMMRFWDLATGIQLVCQHNASAPVLAFSPDGNQLAGGSLNGDIYLWDLSDQPPKKAGKRSWFRS